jgi:hypothetical protein
VPPSVTLGFTSCAWHEAAEPQAVGRLKENTLSTRFAIEFNEVDAPLGAPVTKFGGQPHWLEAPQWPLSRESGEPMRFICQIRIPETLSTGSTRIAYVFMTDGDGYIDGTWEPEGGENAVVVQPGGGSMLVECASIAEGPTLYRMVQTPGADRLTPEKCEFAVLLSEGAEPDFVTEAVRWTHPEPETKEYFDAIGGNKVGGTPMFIQGDEFPPAGPWNLLLQLDSTCVPFFINFGDAGVGYVFLSLDGKQGRLLWQCA